MSQARRQNLLLVCLFVLVLGSGFLLWKHLFHRPPADELPVVTNVLGMEFRLIPAGSFTMGSPANEDGRDDDEHEHEVEITKPFYLGRYEVTQEQFEKVMGFNPSIVRSLKKGKGGADHPVENVSWFEAVEFCKKLSELPEEKKASRTYRLPTEAEWEDACRAGKKGLPFGFGNRLTRSEANLYYDKNKRVKGEEGPPPAPGTKRVGSQRGNRWQMHDMHGNVWEWCADWYDSDYYRKSLRTDPQGPKEGTRKVIRGGSRVNEILTARSANRVAMPPDIRLGMGLHVVLVEGQEP